MALIEVYNLKKTFVDGEVKTPALRGVSFDVGSGEFVAIMGPSGSGKSTLLHILGFLDFPSSGKYHFDGRSISDYTKGEIAHVRNAKMGFVFQTFNLLARASVYENVVLPLIYSSTPRSKWHGIVTSAIDSVNMSHRIDHEPSQLSGGERQRVALARALVNKPLIIFADEPTGNLDSKSGQVVMEILQKLNKDGHTVILITHETYTSEYAGRIIRLKDGGIESDKSAKHRRAAGNQYKK